MSEKGKKTKVTEFWEVEDCYRTSELFVHPNEIALLWRELQDCARDLVRCQLVEHRWYRTDLKSGPHGCGTCFQRELCAAEVKAGGVLSDDNIAELGAPRNEAQRLTWRAILSDPRVIWHKRHKPEWEAVREVYGAVGVDVVQAAADAGAYI